MIFPKILRLDKAILATGIMAVLTASAVGTAEPQLPALPQAVSSFGATVCDGYLYVYGGHAGKTHSYDTRSVLGSFHRLKLSAPERWEELPGGPIAQGLNLVSHKGKVYRVGGMQPRNAPGEAADNHSLAEAARFDPVKRQWEELPPLPAGRSSHDVVVAGDLLVVVGGWQLRGRSHMPLWHESTLVADLKEQPWKWQAIPQPFRRRALAAAAIGQKVYVVGGLSPDGPEPRLDILDLARRQWSRGPDLPGKERAAFAPAACVLNGQLIVATNEGVLYRLLPEGKEWEKVGQASRKRQVARLLPWSEQAVLLLGGAGGGQNHDSLEIIPIPPRPEPTPEAR
jgi:N-acetylneuraminic acid mutarotase